jgi:hypothetical protein
MTPVEQRLAEQQAMRTRSDPECDPTTGADLGTAGAVPAPEDPTDGGTRPANS